MIIFVVTGLGYIAITNDEAVRSNIKADYSEARQLIATFRDGDVAFDLEPQAPITEFVYIETTKEQVVISENGTETIQNVTKIERVESSEIFTEIRDRQTGQIKIVKRGHQSDITGIIVLRDPISGVTLKPPYTYHFTLECDFRDFCNTNPIGINEITDGSGKFLYSWTTDSTDTLGFYQAFVRVTSIGLDSEGKQPVIEHYMTLELIE